MARADERRFVLFERGHVRDRIVLASMRDSLRELVNPDTGIPFTEDEIARATQEGSRYYAEADAIDLIAQAQQMRASWLVDQSFPRRASSGYLYGVHQELWLPDGPLPAKGGTGTVRARAAPGTIWVGSSVVPNPAARVFRDANGKRYQVFETRSTPASGEVVLLVRGIDGGDATNLLVGSPAVVWVNPPPGAEPEATIETDFTGGINAETDLEFAGRIEDAMRFRPGAGNEAHFRAWAKNASASVEDAFVYPCALDWGSVVVAVTQKRGNVKGPLARVPNASTLADVTAALTPPGSSLVPGNVHVLVTGALRNNTDLALRVGLGRGIAGGWKDATPWPIASAADAFVEVNSVVDQTHFRILTAVPPTFDLPAAPSMMIWDKDTSRFESLDVLSVSLVSDGIYDVVLGSAPTMTISGDEVVSPDTDRREALALAVEAYFDALGPYEILDIPNDPLGHRAKRFPPPSFELPYKITAKIVSDLLEQLGGAATDVQLLSPAAGTAPALPVSRTYGPGRLVLRNLGVYDVEDV